jgi:hypothetical protein
LNFEKHTPHMIIFNKENKMYSGKKPIRPIVRSTSAQGLTPVLKKQHKRSSMNVTSPMAAAGHTLSLIPPEEANKQPTWALENSEKKDLNTLLRTPLLIKKTSVSELIKQFDPTQASSADAEEEAVMDYDFHQTTNTPVTPEKRQPVLLNEASNEVGLASDEVSTARIEVIDPLSSTQIASVASIEIHAASLDETLIVTSAEASLGLDPVPAERTIEVSELSFQTTPPVSIEMNTSLVDEALNVESKVECKPVLHELSLDEVAPRPPVQASEPPVMKPQDIINPAVMTIVPSQEPTDVGIVKKAVEAVKRVKPPVMQPIVPPTPATIALKKNTNPSFFIKMMAHPVTQMMSVVLLIGAMVSFTFFAAGIASLTIGATVAAIGLFGGASLNLGNRMALRATKESKDKPVDMPLSPMAC